MSRSAKPLVERLFTEQYPALLSFFYRRVRTKADVPDLAQEVYLRMLRVSDVEGIRSPERYLFTVASNLVKENAVLDGRSAGAIGIDQLADEQQPVTWPTFENDLDTARRTSRLQVVLGQLPAKCRAAVLMQYRDGLSYQEIAERLDVSPHMVKKYLSQALLHCRRRMARLA